MADDEILVEIRIPKPGPGSGGAYTKLERKVGDYAISAAAVQLKMSGDTISEARIGLTNVSAVPMRAKGRRGCAHREEPQRQTCSKRRARRPVQSATRRPTFAWSVDYKRDITRVMVKRSIEKAVTRANGGNR